MWRKFGVSRRSLMTGAAAGAVALGLERKAWSAASDPWAQATAIATRLAAPTFFPNNDFFVTAFGAATCQLVGAPVAWSSTTVQAPPNSILTPAAGSYDCYPAFTAAIQACNAAGGGRVVVPAGNWYCAGPVVLLSNVNFHLNSGAQIWFSNNPADFAKYGPYDCGPNGKLVIMRWQGNDCLNFCPPVYAYQQNNIALTGDDWTSILNGQGGTFYNDTNCWWTWKGKTGTAGWQTGMPGETTVNPLNLPFSVVKPSLGTQLINLIEYGNPAGGTDTSYLADSLYLPNQSEASIPVTERIYGIGHVLRPPMIQIYQCTNVLLSGYQTTNTPFWQHNPVGCRNLLVHNVYANSTGPNNDGCDPESCNYVLIDGCQFNTGDDCIAVDSGKSNDTQFGPSQNVVVQNCTMQSGHGGLTLGSIMAGGIQNVYAQNCVFENVNYATNTLQIAIRLKANMNRGGFLRNFYVRNITVPNGIQTTPGYYTPLPGSPILPKTVSTSSGGLITFDCDYNPGSDNVRIRPPQVSNINISNVQVSAAPGRTATCYQALIVQGPVAYDYNGFTPIPPVYPVMNVTISDSDLGTPTNTAQPVYLYNAQNIVLSNVKIGGQVYNTTLSA